MHFFKTVTATVFAFAASGALATNLVGVPTPMQRHNFLAYPPC